MTPHAVDLLVRELAVARAGLVAVAQPLDQAEMDRRPAPGRWSPGEILDHLGRSESGVVKVVSKLHRDAAGAGDDADLPDQRGRLDFALVLDRTDRRPAPDLVVPRHGRPREGLLNDLARSRIGLLEVARRIHGSDLRGRTFLHPLFGQLDAYQWLVFVAQHETRHTAQFKEAL